MKEIKLTQGAVAFVDDDDYEMINQFKWCLENGNGRFLYAVRGVRYQGKHQTIKMHRFILNAPKGVKVDHKNFNGLDNRRCNIRIATNSQNQWNQKLPNTNTSGFKGVCFFKRDKIWIAGIKIYGKRINLGRFNSKIEAAKVYDEAALKYHGEFAQTNRMLGLLK